MVFSSLPFLFIFLPAVLTLYFLMPAHRRSGRNAVLLVMSLLFYSYGGLRLLPVVAASILVNYFFGLALARRPAGSRSRALLAGGLACNLAILFWFKYANFAAAGLTALGASLTLPEITLPIGISFYTFQGMSYLIDLYRGETEPQRNFLRLALFIVLFTQLVAGPIVRYHSIAGQLEARRETVEDFSSGLLRFLFGLAKKVLLANQLAQVADAAFQTAPGELSAGFAWLGILAYAAQIYFDFSGYSDMAIGLGRVFGLHFAENFNYPYTAHSVANFWQRWHISLGIWFRDYLYIPLGGKRVGTAAQLRNLLIVWLLTGLWHGAAWNYVVWGLYYGALLMGERFLWKGLLERMPKALRHVYAMFFVILGWAFFRSATLPAALQYWKVLFGGGAVGLWDARASYFLLSFRLEYLLAALAALPLKRWVEAALEKRSEHRLPRLLLAWGPPILALALFALSIMRLVSSSFNPFIYFQF